MATTEQLSEILVHCCTVGDHQTLRQVRTEYPEADLNMTTEGGVTLLMHTIIGAGTSPNPSGLYVETCRMLIQECGIALETPDIQYGRTAAHWATYYHRDDILGELIIAGGDMTCPDFSGNSPFHLAIQESATKCLHEALRFLPKQILEIPDSQSRLPLTLAIQLGNTEAIQLLIEAGADVNTIDELTGRTPLHFAVELGELGAGIVEFLIRSGGLLDILDGNGQTPIHLASIVESKEPLVAITKVVGGGEVLDLPDGQGLTPLMYACSYGNEENVKFLIKKKASLSAQDGSEGKVCLHWAAESAHPAAPNIVQLLCKKQNNLIEAKDGFGRTPLHCCAKSGSVETLQMLISLTCDLSSVDSEGRTAAYWAVASGNFTVLAALLEAGCPANSPDIHGVYPLHYAVNESREPDPTDIEEYTEEGMAHSQNVQQCVTVLLEKGVPVDCQDTQGRTPLHWAVQLPNNLAVCTMLLDHGADPNAKDNDQLSALHMAARVGLTQNCQFLLEHTKGHYGNEVDAQGQSALHHAVSCDGVECVAYLLSCGLSANQPDQEMRTPSHVAATIGSVQCLQTLQAYGASLSLKSKYEATPLHEAAANGNADALEFIVTVMVGAEDSVNEPAEGGATALHYAVSGGHEECVRVLVQYGADINSITTTEEGEHLTPLDYCAEENADLAELLRSFGGLTGTAAAEQKAAAEKERAEATALIEAESTMTQEQEQDKKEPPTDEKIHQASLPGTRPSSRISMKSPSFEVESVATPTDGATTPKRVEVPDEFPYPGLEETRSPGLLERALSILKRSKSQVPPGSIFSSAIGFYAAHATMLAAAIIGTPLGDKTMEVAQKVATDTADELKKSAAALDREIPDLVWLREEVETTRTPTPVVEEKSPTPPPPPSPPISVSEIPEDPYDRRLRKARAQMDMSKSAGFLAVEELVKAQETHMRLKRQFQEAQLDEDIKNRRQVFHSEEAVAKEASNKVMKRFTERMSKAEAESKEMNDTIEHRLKLAREENAKLTRLMSSMGINPRPTVSEWIKQKNEQKKSAMQEALIDWDRGKQTRETAILLQQAITSQRAMRHAAWGAKKDINSKLKALKTTPLPKSKQQPSQLPGYKQSRNVAMPKRNRATKKLKTPANHVKTATAAKGAKPKSKPTKATPTPSSDFVRITPAGFCKMRDTPAQQNVAGKAAASERQRLQQQQEEMWQMGQNYIEGKFTGYKRSCPPSEDYLRATGPKSVHAERTLYFYHPEQYKAAKSARRVLEKQLSQQLGLSPARSSHNQIRHGNSSSITIHSLNFEPKNVSAKGRRSFSGGSPTLGHGAKFHTLADSIGNTRRPKRSKSSPGVDVQVLPMTVLDPNQIPATVAT